MPHSLWESSQHAVEGLEPSLNQIFPLHLMFNELIDSLLLVNQLLLRANPLASVLVSDPWWILFLIIPTRATLLFDITLLSTLLTLYLSLLMAFAPFARLSRHFFDRFSRHGLWIGVWILLVANSRWLSRTDLVSFRKRLIGLEIRSHFLIGPRSQYFYYFILGNWWAYDNL